MLSLRVYCAFIDFFFEARTYLLMVPGWGGGVAAGGLIYLNFV
jgi:hypothetical protein